MADETLIFTTFLPSQWYKFALYMIEYVEQCVGIPAIVLHDGRLEDFATGDADASFIDMFSYFQVVDQHPCPIELVAVPVLQECSEDDEASPFFAVVVRQESAVRRPDDLEGCVWVYHGEITHGKNDFLYRQGVPGLNSAKMIETSSPAQALRCVLDGKADAASLDAHILDLVLHNSPCMAARLRVVARGCRTVHPLIGVAAQLDASLKQKIRAAFLTVHEEPFFAHRLHEQAIERFAPAWEAYDRGTYPWYGSAQRRFYPFATKEWAMGMPEVALAQNSSSYSRNSSASSAW